MTLQGPNLAMVALAVEDDQKAKPNPLQPSLADGIHLRWALGPGKGFPWYGFYLFRRLHRKEDPRAITQSLQSLTLGHIPTDTYQTTQGTFVSDAGLVATDDYGPAGPDGVPELDLAGRSYLRFDLAAANVAYWVEVKLYFRADAVIIVKAFRSGIPITETRAKGVAGSLQTAVLQADAIDAIQFSSGPAALVDVKFAPLTTNVNRGWEKVPDVSYPLTLPLTHPDYPCTLGQKEDITQARQTAFDRIDRIHYGDPFLDIPDPTLMDDHGTVTVSHDSPFVVGSGTDWTNHLAGGLLEIPGDATAYLILTVLSADRLVLSRGYGGTGGADLPYAIQHDPFGQIHDTLVHLVKGGPASRKMAERILPLPVADQGMVDITSQSQIVKGTGTAWTTDLIGLYLTIGDQGPAYRVNEVFSQTQLSIVPAYAGASVAGATYTIATQLGPQKPLDLVQLAALHPTAAAMLGLYWIDKIDPTPPMQVFDYLIVSAHKPLVLTKPTSDPGQDALDWIKQNGLEDDTVLDAYVVFSRQIGPADPLEPPIDPEVYALPTAGFLEPGSAGLRWNLGEVEQGGLLPGKPVMYHVLRADLGTTEPTKPPSNYKLLTQESPVLVLHSDPPGKTNETRDDWPPQGLPQNLRMRFIDNNLSEGWYSYRVCGIDIFGRYSRNSDPAPWLKWQPDPKQLPWYWQNSTGLKVHDFAVALLDKFPPPPPTGVEAFALDPSDPLVVRDDAYFKWWNALTASAGYQALSADVKKELIGLRVRWLWTEAEMQQAPDAAEFRVYLEPGPLNALFGHITSVTPVAGHGDQSLVKTDIPNPHGADAYKEASLRIGPDAFPILASDPGDPLVLPPLVLTVRSGPVVTTGQVAVTDGITSVIGDASAKTAWTQDLVGLTFQIAGEKTIYHVLQMYEVDGATRVITLDKQYHGTSRGGVSYTISGKIPPANRACSVVLPSELGSGEPHPKFADFKDPTRWSQRFRVVDYGDHVSPVLVPAPDQNGLILRGERASVVGDTVSLLDLPSEADFANIDQAVPELVRLDSEGLIKLRSLCLMLDDGTDPAPIYQVSAIDASAKTVTVQGAPKLSGQPKWVLGYPARRYEVFLPDPADSNPVGLGLAPSRADPIVYGSIGVSTADDKAHTGDKSEWHGKLWGDRTGNEGQVSAPATVFCVLRRPPDPPAIPVFDSDKLYATRADYHSHSFYTVRWAPAEHLKVHIYRALDEAVFAADWVIRVSRTALDPGDNRFMDLFSDLPPLADKQAIAAELNGITSSTIYTSLSDNAQILLKRLPGNAGAGDWAGLVKRDRTIRLSRTALSESKPSDPDEDYFPPEWRPNPDTPAMLAKRSSIVAALNSIGSQDDYFALSNDAQRVLANLPGNERAFMQITIAPLDPDEPDPEDPSKLRWRNRLGPDNSPDFVVDLALRSYQDTLDGRSSNAYFYRVSAADGAYNRSGLSRSTPPVYCPDVTPPRAPVLLEASAGPRSITLRWEESVESDLDAYLLYRTDSSDATRDLKMMDLVSRVALSPIITLRAGEVAPLRVTDAAGKPVSRRLEIQDTVLPNIVFHYRLVAVDKSGNNSEPSAAVSSRAFQLPPQPPTLEIPTWDAGHHSVRLTWTSTDANLECLLERKSADGLVWTDVSGWLPSGIYTFADNPSDSTQLYEYRIKVRDLFGQVNSTYLPQTTP
jgi:hypothetical protein